MKKEEIMLVEYQKAQDSAEHHNNIMWTLIYIGIGLSLFILYKFYTENYPLEEEMLIFGMVILSYFSFIIYQSNLNKFLKYGICKEIEKKHKKYFLGQHTKTGSRVLSYFFLNVIISTLLYTYILSLPQKYVSFIYVGWFFIILQIFYVIEYTIVTTRKKR
ncbi:hypothetical protein J4407_00455 [Candidatus Pacearchaeota archaeon]|nr:hypothetical protein [Candidatus Pacearchaeota archaeon]